MTNLTFGDKLVKHPFTGGVTYNYNPASHMGISHGNEIPFIVKSGLHKDQEIHFAETTPQFGGRMLNSEKVIELLDTAKMPLVVKIGRSPFLVGKGFLARYPGAHDIEILFVATVKSNKLATVDMMEDITFYVSKNIHLPVNKTIAAIMRDLIRAHKGDVIFTNDVRGYITRKIEIPKFTTLKDRKEYTNKIVDLSIEEMKKNSVKPKPGQGLVRAK